MASEKKPTPARAKIGTDKNEPGESINLAQERAYDRGRTKTPEAPISDCLLRQAEIGASELLLLCCCGRGCFYSEIKATSVAESVPSGLWTRGTRQRSCLACVSPGPDVHWASVAAPEVGRVPVRAPIPHIAPSERMDQDRSVIKAPFYDTQQRAPGF